MRYESWEGELAQVPARNPKEQGFRTPIDERIGQDVEHFGGVDSESDPAAVRPGRFQYLINVRIPRGGLTERGGQSKSNTVSVGEIDHICDTSDIGFPWEPIVLDPMILVGEISNKGRAWQIDENGDSSLLRSFEATDELANAITPYGVTHAIGLNANNPGTTPTEVRLLSDGSLVVVLSNTGSSARIYSLFEQTDLYIGWLDGANSLAKISRWDGGSLSLEYSMASVPGVNGAGFILGKLGSGVFAGVAVTFASPGLIDNNIKKRTGVATWSNLAIPTVTQLSVDDQAVRGSRLYFIGRDDTALNQIVNQTRVISTDGSTVTLDHSVAAQAFVAYGVSGTCLAVGADGYLYYLIDEFNDHGTVRIGRYDGVSWTDNVKDLGVELAEVGTASPAFVRGFAAGPRGFYVVVYGGGLAYPRIWASPNTDITETWQEVASISEDLSIVLQHSLILS